MLPHILITFDEFRPEHITRIETAVSGRATVQFLPEDASPEEVETAVQRAEIVFGWPRPEALINSPVRFLQLPSVGYETFVGRGLEQKPGFRMANAGGIMGIPMSEHVLAMMFALVRHIPLYAENRLTRSWRRPEHFGELTGAVLCVVGLGDIGTEIARRGQALGMQVVGVRKHAERTHELVKTVYPVEALDQAVAAADHVVSIMPGGPGTAHLFNAHVFESFKPGACFYNIGRGSSVDEDALIAALKSGHLAGAGLDVFEKEPLPETSPLWDFENVIIAPHVGGRTYLESERMSGLLIRNLNAYLTGQPIANLIIGH